MASGTFFGPTRKSITCRICECDYYVYPWQPFAILVYVGKCPRCDTIRCRHCGKNVLDPLKVKCPNCYKEIHAPK